jgi:hypothetical protein
MELDYFGLRIAKPGTRPKGGSPQDNFGFQNAKSAAEIDINISDSKLAFLEGNSMPYALCEFPI